jgi:hypothetical protein
VADSLSLMRGHYGDCADVSIGRSIRYCSREPGKFASVPGGYDDHCPDDLLSQSGTISRPGLPTNTSKEGRKLLYVDIVSVSLDHRHIGSLPGHGLRVHSVQLHEETGEKTPNRHARAGRRSALNLCP